MNGNLEVTGKDAVSKKLTVALRPPNTPTSHRHPLKADRQWRQLLQQMGGGRGHHLSLLHLGFSRPTLHLVRLMTGVDDGDFYRRLMAAVAVGRKPRRGGGWSMRS